MPRRRELPAIAGSLAMGRAQEVKAIRVGCRTHAYGSPLPDREELLAVLDRDEGYAGFETKFSVHSYGFLYERIESPLTKCSATGGAVQWHERTTEDAIAVFTDKDFASSPS